MKLSDSQRTAIVQLYRLKEKIAAIAAQFGITDAYVCVLARRRGCVMRQQQHRRVTVALR